MKRVNFLGAATASMLALSIVGCNIDDSYDLSKVADNTEIGIGTDDSCFDLPLADVTIAFSTLSNTVSSDGSALQLRSRSSSSLDSSAVLEIVNEISALLPSELDGDYEGGIDLSQLNDPDYSAGLVELLVEELTESEEKCVVFTELVFDKLDLGVSSGGSGDLTDENYADLITTLETALGVESIDEFETAADCAAALSEVLNSEDSAVDELVADLKDEMTNLIVTKSEDIETTFYVSEYIDEAIDIGEDILDILEKNLDGDKNTLSLLFDKDTNLPLEMTLVPTIELSDGTVISVADFVDAAEDNASAYGSEITFDQLCDLLEGMKFSATVEINNYDPSLGDLNLDDKYANVKIIARKRGSLKF